METSPIPPPEFQERSRAIIGDSITDVRSTRSRIAEILDRPGKDETVRRLLARYRFSGREPFLFRAPKCDS